MSERAREKKTRSQHEVESECPPAPQPPHFFFHFSCLEGTHQEQSTRRAAQTLCRRTGRGRMCATHSPVAARAKSFFFSLSSSLPIVFDFHPFPFPTRTRKLPDSRRHDRTRHKNAPCTPQGARRPRRRRRRRPRPSSEVRRRRSAATSSRLQRWPTTKKASSACPAGFASASAGSPRRRRHGAVGLGSSCGAARRRGAWPARRGRSVGAFFF